MSNMGIPIMPQDMMNKIALGTLRNELYMQNMEPIQTTVVPTVLDLLAANDASERLLNSPSQFSTPSEFSKFLEDIRARNEVARLERQGGSQNAGTPTGVGGGAGDLGGQAGDPVVRGSIESGKTIASEMIGGLLDPVEIVSRNYWPRGGSLPWTYDRKIEYLNNRFKFWMFVPFTRERLGVAQNMLREQYARGMGPNFPI